MLRIQKQISEEFGLKPPLRILQQKQLYLTGCHPNSPKAPPVL